MGKGDKRRPTKISAEENELRWQLAFKSSQMSSDEKKALEDKISVLERERNSKQ
jgi:hypothetical protein